MWFYLILISLSVLPLTIIGTLVLLIKKDAAWKKWLISSFIALAVLLISIMAFPVPV